MRLLVILTLTGLSALALYLRFRPPQGDLTPLTPAQLLRIELRERRTQGLDVDDPGYDR